MPVWGVCRGNWWSRCDWMWHKLTRTLTPCCYTHKHTHTVIRDNPGGGVRMTKNTVMLPENHIQDVPQTNIHTHTHTPLRIGTLVPTRAHKKEQSQQQHEQRKKKQPSSRLPDAARIWMTTTRKSSENWCSTSLRHRYCGTLAAASLRGARWSNRHAKKSSATPWRSITNNTRLLLESWSLVMRNAVPLPHVQERLELWLWLSAGWPPWICVN